MESFHFDPKLLNLFNDLTNEKLELKPPLKHERCKRLLNGSLSSKNDWDGYQNNKRSKKNKRFYSFVVNHYTLFTEGGKLMKSLLGNQYTYEHFQNAIFECGRVLIDNETFYDGARSYIQSLDNSTMLRLSKIFDDEPLFLDKDNISTDSLREEVAIILLGSSFGGIITPQMYQMELVFDV